MNEYKYPTPTELFAHIEENVENKEDPITNVEFYNTLEERWMALHDSVRVAELPHLCGEGRIRIVISSISIAGEIVPFPLSKQPKKGDAFYIPCLDNAWGAIYAEWDGSPRHLGYLKKGLVYSSREDARKVTSAVILGLTNGKYEICQLDEGTDDE